MSANMYNFLRAFHTFLYKTGGHVYRHFVVKPRAYCRLVTGIVGDGTLVILGLIALAYSHLLAGGALAQESKSSGDIIFTN